MSDTLQSGERLNNGGTLLSENSRFKLGLQGDGNFVLYKLLGDDHQALWASGTNGRTVTHAVMQGDGNLVLRDPDHNAVWATGTDGNPGAFLAMQNDGNLVIYSSNHKALWATNTVQPPMDNPVLAQLLAAKIKAALALYNSEDNAWYNDGKETEDIKVAGVKVGSITYETKTWLWLDDPNENLTIDVYKLRLRDGELEIGISAHAKARFKAWGKVPKIVTTDVKGSARVEITIAGSARLAGTHITDANITKLDADLHDVRFSNDALKAIQGLIRDVMNQAVNRKEKDLARKIEQAMNEISF
jgi:hypothetical protein